MAIKVTTPTLINNRSTDSYSTSALIELISNSVSEVERLKNLGFKSKTVSAMIASEEKGQAAAIEILDSRNTDEEWGEG